MIHFVKDPTLLQQLHSRLSLFPQSYVYDDRTCFLQTGYYRGAANVPFQAANLGAKMSSPLSRVFATIAAI